LGVVDPHLGDVIKASYEIDAWHESDSDKSLHEWLGLTWEEHQLYVKQPDSLAAILQARRQRGSVDELLQASPPVGRLAGAGGKTES